MSSLKGKLISLSIIVLAGASIYLTGAEIYNKEQRKSLREKVYDLVQKGYNGSYRTSIDGKTIDVYAVDNTKSPSHVSSVNYFDKRLDVEIKCDKKYFSDSVEAWAPMIEDREFGKLDYWQGSKEDPEKEFDNYLRLVKKKIGKP